MVFPIVSFKLESSSKAVPFSVPNDVKFDVGPGDKVGGKLDNKSLEGNIDDELNNESLVGMNDDNGS